MSNIKEIAKAYDDLLVKLQKAKEDNDVCDDRYCCVIDAIVPELAESEDERIRKEIVRFIQMEVEDEIVGNKWLAWLEKRGEQKPAWKPSGEQMKYLRKYAEQNNYDGRVLTSLFNDLKKLREV